MAERGAEEKKKNEKGTKQRKKKGVERDTRTELSLFLIKNRTVKMYGGVKVQLHSF